MSRHGSRLWTWVILALLLALTAAGCGRGTTQPSGGEPGQPAGDGSGSTAETEQPGDAEKSSYPEKPIKMIVSRGAGGSTDTAARLLAPYLEKALGQPVVVENVTGAGGVIGNEQVFKSAPDGYTILFTVSLTDVLNQVVEGTPYDYRESTPIYNVGGGDSNLLVVNANSEIKTFADFVAKAKAGPVTVGKLNGVNIASIGLALLEGAAGIPAENLSSVPYTSGAEPGVAVAGGHVDAALAQPSGLKSLIEEGKLRVLAFFGQERLPEYPDVPTFDELFPGEGQWYEAFQSIMAPPGTPDAVVAVLNEALDQATSDPEFLDKAGKVFSVSPLSSAELKTAIAQMFEQAESMKGSLRN